MKKSLTSIAVLVALFGVTGVTYAHTHTFNKRESSNTHTQMRSVWKKSGKVLTVKGPNQTPATSTPLTVTTPVVMPSVPTTTVTTPVVSVAGEIRMQAYTTGYSYWDNTPAASAEISNPVIHQTAGGIGTYADPITLAVGHSIINGNDILDYPAGTKFYVPNLRKYFIAEDTCGDGITPQNGPCHSGYQGHVWVDLYVDGASTSRSQSDSCMNAITDIHTVIQNPASNYAVVAGDLSANCQQYGETVVTQ